MSRLIMLSLIFSLVFTLTAKGDDENNDFTLGDLLGIRKTERKPIRVKGRRIEIGLDGIKSYPLDEENNEAEADEESKNEHNNGDMTDGDAEDDPRGSYMQRQLQENTKRIEGAIKHFLKPLPAIDAGIVFCPYEPNKEMGLYESLFTESDLQGLNEEIYSTIVKYLEKHGIARSKSEFNADLRYEAGMDAKSQLAANLLKRNTTDKLEGEELMGNMFMWQYYFSQLGITIDSSMRLDYEGEKEYILFGDFSTRNTIILYKPEGIYHIQYYWDDDYESEKGTDEISYEEEDGVDEYEEDETPPTFSYFVPYHLLDRYVRENDLEPVEPLRIALQILAKRKIDKVSLLPVAPPLGGYGKTKWGDSRRRVASVLGEWIEDLSIKELPKNASNAALNNHEEVKEKRKSNYRMAEMFGALPSSMQAWVYYYAGSGTTHNQSTRDYIFYKDRLIGVVHYPPKLENGNGPVVISGLTDKYGALAKTELEMVVTGDGKLAMEVLKSAGADRLAEYSRYKYSSTNQYGRLSAYSTVTRYAEDYADQMHKIESKTATDMLKSKRVEEGDLLGAVNAEKDVEKFQEMYSNPEYTQMNSKIVEEVSCIIYSKIDLYEFFQAQLRVDNEKEEIKRQEKMNRINSNIVNDL